MIGTLLLPIGLGLIVGRRRSRRRPRTIVDPRAISGRACCHSCARDQRLGKMAPGTTCSPCAAKTAAHKLQSYVASECEVLPFDVWAVDEAILRFQREGSDADEIATVVLQSVYPRTTAGVPLTWSALADRDPWCLHALRHRVHARVCAALATLHDAACDRAWAAAGFPVVPVGTGGVQ